MRIGGSHLGYCTNIHPGESWDEIRANLEQHLPPVKRAVCPGAPFGVGLRLSAVAAESLAEPAMLADFVHFLRAHDLYVFTINGFPYGPFHGRRVKEDVYLPDWNDEARLAYTNRLADLLVELWPDGRDDYASISTVPGAFKPRAATPQARARIAGLLVRHVAHLVRLERSSGRRVVLALEPEPCCLLETVDETIAFFRDALHGADAAATLAGLVGVDRREAARLLQRHLGVCLDLCHAAVEFEDPAQALQRLEDAGIAIAKMQVTAGLQIPRVDEGALASLARLEDGVYLHQVVEREDRALRRYVDLDAARAGGRWHDADCEWRVHFHVPVFVDALEGCASTQPFVRDVLARQRERPRTSHLELETYTWSVLPAWARDMPVDDAIAGELRWTRDRLA